MFLRLSLSGISRGKSITVNRLQQTSQQKYEKRVWRNEVLLSSCIRKRDGYVTVSIYEVNILVCIHGYR